MILWLPTPLPIIVSHIVRILMLEKREKREKQFRIFPIFSSVDITVYQYGKNVLYSFYNIAQRTLTEEWRKIFRVDIKLYQQGSQPISVQNLQMLYYKKRIEITCSRENKSVWKTISLTLHRIKGKWQQKFL